MTVRIYTLGRLSLEREGAPVRSVAAQPRRLALLAALAAAGPRGMAREKLAGLLWPRHSSNALLNESVFVLRGTLGKDAIVTAGDSLHLDPGVAWADVAAFDAAMAEGRFAQAVELYAGPFVDGFYVRDAPEFERWAAEARDHREREAGRAMEALAGERAAAGDLAGCAEWWRRRARHDAYSVRVALACVDALADAGEPVLAVRFAADFTERVRRELGVEPERSVLGHARARAGAGASAHDAPPPAGPERTAAGGGELEGLGADFEVSGPIGEGSVARVYLARERALRRAVAVKVLLPHLARDETARARFEREAIAAAAIHHPHVAPVYRTGRLACGAPYLVMPYFHGGSLESRLQAGAFDPAEARRYLGQIAAGLAAAHAMGTVHRDVRPANILYDRDTHRMVLIDFGIAAVRDAADPRLTRPGERLGSPAYVSPEQLWGDPELTDRSDVYSLGVVAFQMLTGRLPYGEATGAALMRIRATATPPTVSAVYAAAGSGLDALVERCLATRPQERPSAADVAEELAGSA
ncbi:MAG TPA: protein kinase [Longimicrobium sp.]|jgi:DNA-binding SARP family transcriptional activator